MAPSWSDSRFAKSACWRFSWRSRRGFKPKPCDSAPQCLWSATRPKESPNGHSNLLPSNVHGSILQRNAPVDLFGAVRSVDLCETSVIALCRRSFFSVGWDNCSPSGTYFPESSSFRLGGSIDVIVRASDGSTGKDLITVYYQSRNQKSLELEVFLEREKTSNWRLNASARV